MQKQAKDLQIKNSRQLELVVTGLKDLQDQYKELSEQQARIESTIEKRDAQSRADVLVGFGKQAEQKGDFDEAITRYELALGEQPDNPVLKAKLDELKEQWRIKSPAHEAARKFVYEDWTNAEITDFAALLPDAERALAALRLVDDSLTALKLQNVTIEHSGMLNDLISRLSERTSEDDRKELEKYDALNDKLLTFLDSVAELRRRPSSATEAGSDAKTETPEAAPEGDSAPSSLLDLDKTEEEKPLEDNGGKK
ncbi:MAG: hypothetical protein ABI619_11230 [Betaproteobacteria bacterium]